MRIAVLMSTYNGEKYLREQIDSIINQEFDGIIDIIVRDDGSTDSTVDILKEYKKKELIDFYSGNNIGASFSFFELLLNCDQYDFYAFSDQDDVWKKDKISKAVKNISCYDAITPVMYCSNAALVDENLNRIDKGAIYRKIPNIDFYSSTCFCYCLGCTCVLNDTFVSIIRKTGMPKHMIMHDTFLEELCQTIGGKVIYDHYESVLYKQHANNVSGYGIGGIWQKIIHRIKFINTKRTVGIAEQAEEILTQYSEKISEEKIEYLQKIAQYKNSVFKRLKLASDRKVKYKSLNTSLMYRLAIIMGNL